MKTLTWICIQFICVDISYLLGNEILPEEKLQKQLFDNYNVHIRPVRDFNVETQVGVGAYLISILSIDEKENFMTSYLWVDVTWNDFRLVWNKTEHGEIDTIVVDTSRVWQPDIVIRNEMGNKRNFEDTDCKKAVITYNGTVSLWPGKDITTPCNLDTTKFPFDQQICDIVIGKWYSSDRTITIHEFLMQPILNFYKENEEWQIIDASIEKRVYAEGPPGDYFSRLHCKFTLKRRPLWHILNMVIPLIMLSFVNPMCFKLPIESGEKTGMSLSICLTFAVFLTLVSDSLPRSSIHIPVFSVYLVFETCLSGLTIVLEVIVSYVYNSDPSGNSILIGYLQKFYSKCTMAERKGKRNKNVSSSTDMYDKHGLRDNGTDDVHLEVFEDNTSKFNLQMHDTVADHTNINKDCKDIAIMMDRVFFFLMTMLNILAVCIFFICVTS